MTPTILLVDDDDFARHFSRVVLERAGYCIVEATDVASAVEAAHGHRFGVVLADFFLPDGNGVELARRLHEKDAQLPILLISGDTSQVDALTSSEHFAAVIQKPFTPATLAQAVAAAQARAATPVS